MSKSTGSLFEQKFIVEALSRGLHPHQPIGDYLPHDVIVTNNAGRSFKVQIKGTSNAHRESDRPNYRWRITASTGRSNSKIPIDCSKVDAIAAYVETLDAWYVIPCLQVTSMAVWLYPNNPKSRGRYEKYRDNWDYFLG
jgi:hypothetical protein